MGKPSLADLSRRERQIMDVVFASGRATAADVRAAIPDPPSYSTVRALLGILEQKSFLKHRTEAGRYVYFPAISPAQARQAALKRVLRTFFNGSVNSAVMAMIDMSGDSLSDEDLAGLQRQIKKARRERK